MFEERAGLAKIRARMATASVKAIARICVAALLLASAFAQAQNNGGPPAAPSSRGNQQWKSANENDPDQTLEIAPRIVSPPPPIQDDQSEPATGSAPPEPDTSGIVNAPENAGAEAQANPPRPYLGIGVQYIVSHDTPGRDIHGLEVVSVDQGSPAQRAGLHPRGAITELGATGTTAGALMAPLDLVVMPLLKKTGQLGESGDLIIAIDDRRVDSESDLKDELDAAKPGDTIYFTLVRTGQNGKQETLKIPVKLGAPMVADASPPAAPTAAPSTPPAMSPPVKSPADIAAPTP